MATIKYDLHKIMSNAHKLYKNARVKYSTFASALRKAWSMAKFEVKVAAGREQILKAEAERKAIEAERKEQAKIEKILFNARMESRRIMFEAEAKANYIRREIEARKAGLSYNDYMNGLAISMGYGSNKYLGD